MKAILEFDLPEDRDEFTLAKNGGRYYGVLYELAERELKPYLDYGQDKFKTPEEVMEWVYKYIHESVDLFEVE